MIRSSAEACFENAQNFLRLFDEYLEKNIGMGKETKDGMINK